MVGALSLSLWACLPPEIADEEIEEGAVLIVKRDENLVPSGSATELDRPSREEKTFDVTNVFSRTDGVGQGLQYYWYVDWTTSGGGRAPRPQRFPQLSFEACANIDPPVPGEVFRPAERTLMVVVSTEELDNPNLAFLGAAPNAAVAAHLWTVTMVGQCSN